MPSPIGSKSPLFPPIEEKPPLRAYDVAEDYFKRELAVHEGMAGAAQAGTVVIVHDQCYGHRYSRPKTSKSTLNLIMERPERLLASVLGISTAYVRLGGRHCDGSNAPHPDHNPDRVPFKIRKTSRTVDITSPVVTNVHGVKWMEELKTLCVNAEHKLATTGKELSREGPSAPGQPPKEQFHAGDLYLCAESLNAFQGALGGVLDAVDAVFQGTNMGTGPSRAFVCVRPPGHHCSADFPSGFCWLNNVHVGIEHAMTSYGLTHAAIIDFDLHHGDGSQSITWARNKKVQGMPKNTSNSKKTSIGYFSLHDVNSYPCEDGDDAKVQAASLCIDNAHGQSIWNIHLQGWRTIEEFWSIYEDKYVVLLEKASQYLKHHTNRLKTLPNHPRPKAAIFLSAGFDASEWETAGMQRHAVNVPTEFYARFTRDVVRLAEEASTGCEGRVISVLEGGYSDRALTSGVLSHISGLVDGQVWSDSRPSQGLEFDMRQRLGGVSRSNMLADGFSDQSPEPASTLTPVVYDPAWWHESNLRELQNLRSPPAAAIPKKIPEGPPPTYSSPTQSFTAKVVDPTKLYRNVPGRYMSGSPSRAPTPPPPDVDWATAAQALSKLLIPSDRQIHSCKPEELAEPKVKKEKPVAPVLASVRVDPSGRQLRGRKLATYADPDAGDGKLSVRPVSRADRRRTIADLPIADAEPPAGTRVLSRRMSIASSVGSVAGDMSVSRPNSVAASRRSTTPAPSVTSNGVQAKKVRGTSTASARMPKNQPPPIPRVPLNYQSSTTAPKENENDVDQLTAGLKRITLKLPSREEYEAREKQKEAEKKAAAKPRKPAAPRVSKTTTKAAPKPVAAKKALGRPPKSTKPPSPMASDVVPAVAIPIPLPEPPKVESVVTAPLEAPQPVQLDHTPNVLPLVMDRQASPEPLPAMQPPTEEREMDMRADQLPKLSFTSMVEPRPMIVSPPRPDTPPPPPTATLPGFLTHSFGTPSTINGSLATKEEPQTRAQWMLPTNGGAALPTHAAAAAGHAIHVLSPPSKRQELPKFQANGVIPFASNPSSTMTSTASEQERDIWEVPETPVR
ncbi:Arginase/deacetylase [Pleomassaria siparia CBS 279.74]|uniref:Arginase/deacetylase n=1 Tax=Pleomassaria siparia CBS 279.74 TaxID=1314801 RepID=A0A6G1JYN2_9PLEO|nr:Arginase/deacetylase [Pleomassaria siparia CBS 279.74]